MVGLRFKKMKNGDFSIYLDFYKEGKRKAIFLELYVSKDYSPLFAKHLNKRQNIKIAPKDTEKLRLAKETLLKHELDFVRDKFSFEKTKKIDYVSEIEKIVIIKNHSTYKYMLRYLHTFISLENAFKLDSSFLQNFQAYLLTTKLTHKSVSIYVERFKTVFQEMKKQGIIELNPFQDFTPKKSMPKEKIWLDFDEIEKLASNISIKKEFAYAFLLSCFTGLRYSDIQALEWSQIQSDRIVYTAVKTKKTSYIPLSKAAITILQKWKENKAGASVFQLPKNHNINKDIKKWSVDVGIDKHVTFHTARHTFITLVIEKSGGDIFTASHLAGHSNIATTKIYAHLNDSTRFKVVDLLPNIKL